MVTSKILVVGGEASGKKTLVNEICRNGCWKEGNLVHVIKTKYYSAPVEFHFTGNLTSESIEEEKLADFEACILVYDVTRQSSFDHASNIVERILSGMAPQVCLCVGRKVDLMDEEPDCSIVKEWCLNNSFELIEYGSNKSDCREKCGVNRIIEALECNAWNSMISSNKDGPTKNTGVESEQTIDESAALHDLVGGLPMHDDLDNDMFEKLMRDVLEIRENAAGLPYKVRRERAAQVATNLWELLDSDDEEESNSDDTPKFPPTPSK